MSSVRRREIALAAAAAAGALLVMAWLALHDGPWPDWRTEARPAVDSLLAGHVLRFLQLAPTYGGSLILRAPFVMVTKLWHGRDLAIYAAGAVPCLAATGALGVWLAARMRSRGASLLAVAVALLLCVANPLALPALELGHPEELLGAVLCVAAVLCALHDRPTWAAVLLGLAMANKEWAVVAVGPVLVALPRGRARALLVSGAVAAAVMAPLIIGASGGFVAQATATGLNTGPTFQPWQLWWFFGSHGHAVKGLSAGYRTAPAWIGGLGHTLVIAIMPPLTALYARRRAHCAQPRPNHHVLLLLALLLALRCALDPWDISYYSLPFLLTLLSWEALGFARPPVLTLAATFAAWFIFRETSTLALNLSGNAQAMAFAVVSIPSIVALAGAVYAPSAGHLLLPRSRRGDAMAPAL
ncbi:MAG TPA: hypothetical protein VG325_03165 [Solirubrobacteraceae bacterium]|jgi:hypothetical protein|nr:hypothetical protein [Solirubrobacteraceae bacterium]